MFFPHRILSEDGLASIGQRFSPLAHVATRGGESLLGWALQGGLVLGVAGTTSYLNARHAAQGRRAYEIMGVPADLALGLMFTGLAVTGYFGEHVKHGVNVGNGFLAAYACRMGTMWGEAAKSQFNAASIPVRGAFAAPNVYASHPADAVATPYPWAA